MSKPQDPEAAETVQTTNVPAVDLPRLVRLVRRHMDTSDEPECGCEYQHGNCEAMEYRNAYRELDDYLKEIDLPRPVVPSGRDVLAKREPYTADDLIDAVLACAEEELQGRLSGLENGFDHPNACVLFGFAKGIAISLRHNAE